MVCRARRRDYYRTKPAKWAIYCRDKPGRVAARRTLVVERNRYVKSFGERRTARLRTGSGTRSRFLRNSGYRRDVRITRWVSGD
jgi:hypothetical protein